MDGVKGGCGYKLFLNTLGEIKLIGKTPKLTYRSPKLSYQLARGSGWELLQPHYQRLRTLSVKLEHIFGSYISYLFLVQYETYLRGMAASFYVAKKKTSY